MKTFYCVALVACLAACGSDDDDGDGEGNAAVTACNQYVDASADALIRNCEGADDSDRPAVRDAILAQLPGGGCSGADSIRDAKSFNEECIPGFEMLAVCPMTADDVPASCQDQIQYIR